MVLVQSFGSRGGGFGGICKDLVWILVFEKESGDWVFGIAGQEARSMVLRFDGGGGCDGFCVEFLGSEEVVLIEFAKIQCEFWYLKKTVGTGYLLLQDRKGDQWC